MLLRQQLGNPNRKIFWEEIGGIGGFGGVRQEGWEGREGVERDSMGGCGGWIYFYPAVNRECVSLRADHHLHRQGERGRRDEE